MAAARMCGLAARAWRTSSAEPWSLNASAAVLLVPITFASALRSCICICLKRCTPYSANAILATHKAANVLIMIKYVILRRTESLRCHCMSVVSGPFRSRDCAGEGQQFRADFQARTAGGADVNSEAHALFFHHELNHSAGFDKMIHVPHRQNA